MHEFVNLCSCIQQLHSDLHDILQTLLDVWVLSKVCICSLNMIGGLFQVEFFYTSNNARFKDVLKKQMFFNL